MAKPKRGSMKDIHVDEISMVDKPANMLPFLFFKNDSGEQVGILNKKSKMKIEIESDGTGKGTAISIDGKSLGTLRDFNFSFYGLSKGEPVSCSYSKVVEAEDGFKRTETFYLSKGIIMDEKTLKALQAYLGTTDDIDFEKKIGEEEIQKALTLITKEYKADLPEDLENAIGVIAKRAVSTFNVKKDEKGSVEKAGAKFSKDALKKLRAAIAAIEAIKGLLPKEESTEKSDTSGLAKSIEELNKAVEGLSKQDNTESNDDKLAKALGDMAKRLETVEKATGTKTSIEGQENDNETVTKGAGKDGEVLWPSLQPKSD